MRDALGNPQSVLVLGGGSDIALATVRRLVAGRTRTVVLATLNPDQLAQDADELRAAGATTVEVVAFDAEATDEHPALVDDLFDRFGDFDVVMIAFGILGDQARAAHDHAAALEIARVNYVGTVSVAVLVAERLLAQGHGTIVALSSVAGERARRSNFVYGSTKAGMDTFLQGLGDTLHGTGVRVMVVRPGFVYTKMTEGLTPAPLATTADKVAEAIVDGLARDKEIIWVPSTMRYVMAGLRHLPRAVFRKLPI